MVIDHEIIFYKYIMRNIRLMSFIASIFMLGVSCHKHDYRQEKSNANIPSDNQITKQQLAEIDDKLNKNPNSAVLHNERGKLLLFSGYNSEAEKEFKKSIELDLANPDPYLNLSYLYYMNGDFISRLKYAKKATELDPKNPAGYVKLLNSYEEHHKYPDAYNECLKAEQALKNVEGDVYSDRFGNTYGGMQDLKKAVDNKCKELKSIIKVGMPRKEVYGSPDELAEIEKQLKEKPNSAFLHNQKAVFLASKGEREAAKEELKIAINLDPKDNISRYQLGQLYYETNDIQSALKCYYGIIKLDKNNLYAHMSIIHIYSEEDRIKDGLNACKEAAKAIINVKADIYYDDFNRAWPNIKFVKNDINETCLKIKSKQK